MDTPSRSIPDTPENFPHLSHAPITEAVLELRVLSDVQWSEEAVIAALTPQMTLYKKPRSARLRSVQFQLSPGQEAKVKEQDLGWQGLQFESEDGRQIAKFQADAFSFSRLKPYEGWEQFQDEALRLWFAYSQLVHPSEIQRMGVRFINKFDIQGRINLQDYFRGFPEDLPHLDLTFAGFLHHDIRMVPGGIFGINVIKTAQPPEVSSSGVSLILDIDVYTLKSLEPSPELLQERLAECRLWKNRCFFGIITDTIKQQLQE
jgi:uncharacterized protein (TIGR04255 family)